MPDNRTVASPVFVDPTGRRRRTVRRAALAGAAVLIGSVALLFTALLGAPLGPLTPLPEPVSGPPAAVEPAPLPAKETSSSPATSSSRRPGTGDPAVAPGTVAPTTPPGSSATTIPTKGNKPATPPGRPTDRPTPPGHTR